MSGYADGGIVGTKPYVSTSNYINKMSNFCQNCSYDCNQKTGPKACPFNYLYWNFLLKNQESLKDNIRCKMAYATLNKMSSETKKQIAQDSNNFLNSLTYTKYSD
jgi:deoxyribodipyrimidine photolyase-related protein